jgi:hypothetical protein
MLTRIRLAVVSFGLLAVPLLTAGAAEAGLRGP